MKLDIFKSITDKSTSYLNLDIAYFAKSGFWSTFQQFTGIGAGLIVSYLFGHFVSKKVFGEYNLVISILSMLTFFSLPGINTALVRSIGEGYEGSLIKSGHLRLKFSLLAVPVIIFFAFFYFIKGEKSIAISLFIGSLFFPFLYSFNSYQAFLTGKKMFKNLAVFSSIGSIFFLSVIALSIFFLPSTPLLILGYLVGIIAPAIVAYQYSQRFIKKNKRIDANLGRYGLFLTLISILPWISGNLGNIILAGTLGAEALAVYTVAIRFLVSIQKSFMAFYKPVSAKLAQQKTKGHWETLAKHIPKLIIIGFGLSALLWLTLPFLITFFFTAKYKESIYYGRLLSLSLISLPLSWVLTDMMIFQKRKKLQIIISTVPQIIKIGLLLILIPLFKIDGLVAIFLLERYMETAILIFALNKIRGK